ncbi:RNA-directed DNA polymerase, eukaryota, reverse transcriptase zinc-binding domain protein [Tanacetum coccineum]|uniref:RNA-directed DNA polymerase, eukaryota, reverse transcriptase zinc-binding domain protein n=1 Tax=Tanacetum coccineum TaxID=301880 RepID=A0ABQ5J2T9_9ASTR
MFRLARSENVSGAFLDSMVKNFYMLILALESPMTHARGEHLMVKYLDQQYPGTPLLGLGLPIDRAPGPDGFTFKFITTFWDLLEADVVHSVNEFFLSGTFPKGCNSSFIVLIPKVPNAKFVSDFCPISLIGCQYKIIAKILANRLSIVIGGCVSSEQTAFIKGRSILDGPLILNEVIAWYRKRKQKLMVFKVDFEKAFDSIRRDFLDLVMAKLGFGFKWRSWIHRCLLNARSSVLINGSPTSEFEIFRGLRQGDPLSPFLFILAMEGFHAITCKSVETSIFRGVSIGQGNMNISHLIYVDDVIFMGEWSQSNVHNLLCMLRCFYLVSGLKINVQKSKILGVYVSNEDVSDMAKVIRCGVANLSLIYLGIPVGCNMRRCSNWNTIIQKFSSKLSKWKACLLSIGGRLSLIKSGLGNLPTYYMSIYMMPVTIQNKLEMMRNNFFIGGDESEKKMTWVSWKKCLVSKKLGGLGVGSIFALNIGLLFKWLWRFLCQPTDLWAKVVKNIYGPNEGIDEELGHSSHHSTWGAIISSVKKLKSKGTDLLSLCIREIGNEVSTHFWEDIWCGDQPLKLQFLRIFMLDNDKVCYVANRLQVSDWSSFLRRHPRGGVEESQFNSLLSTIRAVSLTDHNDSWLWSLGTSNGFSVASVHSLIDDNSLDVVSNATRWNRSIPIKVNVFLWRLMLNKLPTKVNLDRKGVDVGSILCPICSEDVESANHIFFSCEMAKDLWALFARWWELDIPVFDNFQSGWRGSIHLIYLIRRSSFWKELGDSLMVHLEFSK